MAKPDPIPVPPVVVDVPLPAESLRDIFAGLALLGLLSHVETVGDPVMQAKLAYIYADAMMDRRGVK